MPNGEAANIREVYELVGRTEQAAERRAQEILAAVNSLGSRIEGIDTRLQSHTQMTAHAGTVLELQEVHNKLGKINITLAKYAGGLTVLVTLATLFVKFL